MNSFVFHRNRAALARPCCWTYVATAAFSSGRGVRAKIVCGDYAAGYSLFYGVWEFLYEKVVFFFF